MEAAIVEGIVFSMVALSALSAFTDSLTDEGDTGARLISGLCGVACVLGVWEEIAAWL